MREILFRGKSIDSGEWIEGGYYCEKIGEYITATFIAENLTSQVIGHERVDRKTVGQFTGLTDRNGNKVFEGDIVQAALDGRYYSVEYITDGEYAFNFVDSEKGYTYSLYDFNDVMVIGNIHDNPELLGGDKNGFGL